MEGGVKALERARWLLAPELLVTSDGTCQDAIANEIHAGRTDARSASSSFVNPAAISTPIAPRIVGAGRWAIFEL